MKTVFYRSIPVLIMTLLVWSNSFAQCLNYNINLTGSPDSTWRSALVSRVGQCCSVPSNQNCISFDITLDPRSVGVWFYMTGAPALGSEHYTIGCGAQHSMRDTICLSGVGPHNITFCKPGNNPNEYVIEAIAKPSFPSDDTVRIGCNKEFHAYGVKPGTINWTSIFPGPQGTYDSYMSCLTCTTTVFTPQTGAPAYIDYLVCGDPIATMCGYTLRICDTVRVYVLPPLTGSISPSPASFCNIGINPGVLLTASASGGDGNYNFKWRDNLGNLVGVGPTY